MSLPLPRIQEMLSLSYARAIVARAGFGHRVNGDGLDFGVDLDVYAVSRFENRVIDVGAVFSVQLKATTNATVEARRIRYSLSRDAYTRLKVEATVPRVLLVYVMPEEENEWLDHSNRELKLRRAAYFMRAADIPEMPEGQDSFTISIPKANRFSPEAVVELARPVLDELGIP